MQAQKPSPSRAPSKASRRAVSILVAALAVSASIGSSSASDSKTSPQVVHLSFEAYTAADNPVSVWAVAFAKLVAAKSDNTILIDVHPNSELVSQDGALAALTSDKVNMGELGIPQLPITPELAGLQYLNLPFVTPTWEESIAVGQSAQLRRIFNDTLKPMGLRVLAMCTQGYTSFLSQTPIKTVADFKGLRVRVANAATNGQTVAALGAEPVSVALGSTYKALQEKTVTVAESNIGNFYSLKWYQFAKYLDFIPIGQVYLPIMINLKSYDRLTKAQQGILESVAVSSMLNCDQTEQAAEDDYMKRMEREGLTVVTPDSLVPFEQAEARLVAEGKATPVGRKIARVIEDIHKRAGKK